jgi:hypothetical protein
VHNHEVRLAAIIRRLRLGDAAEQAELNADDLTAINTAAAQITVVGERYPEAMQRMVDR